MEQQTVVNNRQNEAMFIGSLFRNNDLFLEYERIIISKYYFSDEFLGRVYEWLSVLSTRGQAFTEKNLVLYISEDEDRLALYKKYGGWKTIQELIDWADDKEFRAYFSVLQKFALLRELETKGIDTSKIRARKNFDKLSANDVYALLKRKLDDIHTRITSDIELVDVTKEVYSMTEGYLETPAMGTPTFLPTYNDLFRGFQDSSMMCFGLMSNFGKTRFLAKIAAYNALVQKEKTLLMLNEMNEHELRLAILTTVINNPEFKELHHIEVDKIEREIALGLYRDGNGEFIYRQQDPDTKEYTESVEDYKMRVMKNSLEYRNVLLISRWIEENSLDDYLCVLNMAKDYSDLALETTIRKHARRGYRFFAYDNLKNPKGHIGEWSSLIETTTTLTEVAEQEKVFVYGSIQLTPDTKNEDALELNSMNIAASKGLKNVLDILVLGKQIERERYTKYMYRPTVDGFGETSKQLLPLPDLGEDVHLQSHVVDKNRFGSKHPILVKVDLNRNIWQEMGILERK